MRTIAILTLLAMLFAGCSDGASKEPKDDVFGPPPEVLDGKGLIRGLVLTPAIVPVQGASVRVMSTNDTKLTDVNGAFVLANLEPGDYFLTVSKPGWTTVQQSVQVVANRVDPPIVKIAIEEIPGTEPRAVTMQREGFLACSVGLPVTFVNCNTTTPQRARHHWDIEGTPNWIQTEIRWKSTQPTGDWLYVIQGVCTCDGGIPPVRGPRFNETDSALHPHIAWATPAFLAGANAGTAAAKQLVVDVSASGPEPQTTNGSGIALNQAFMVYATFFYNFDPDMTWSFGEDGPYPVPN